MYRYIEKLDRMCRVKIEIEFNQQVESSCQSPQIHKFEGVAAMKMIKSRNWIPNNLFMWKLVIARGWATRDPLSLSTPYLASSPTYTIFTIFLLRVKERSPTSFGSLKKNDISKEYVFYYVNLIKMFSLRFHVFI